MKLIRVAAAVLNQTPLAWDDNLAHVLGAIDQARERGVSVLCLPELCLCGYGCEDAFHAAGLRRTARQMMARVLPHTRGMIVTLGLPVLHNNGLFNVVAVAVDGKLAGLIAKRHLAGDGLHYEPRWFKPWPEGQRVDIELDGQTCPMGDLHLDVAGVRIGFEICEDAWVAQRPGAALAQRGVDLILNPSASHFAFGKLEVRRRFVLEGSRAFGCTYVYSNLVGNEAGRAIYDGGALIASGGKLIAQGPRFTYANVHVTDAVVDLDATRTAQARAASFSPRVERDPLAVPVDFHWPAQQLEATRVDPAAWESSDALKEEEFTRAIALGLFDYLRKSRSRGFVVSLSGGADSAAVSCLAALALEMALRELGPGELQRRLDYCTATGKPLPSSARELVHELLTCVYQATRNSTTTTHDAARAVAHAIGARFLAWDVEPMVEGYTRMVSQTIGRELSWREDDLALQNIQARARAPGVWMVANLTGSLLLTTSNRSEAAVGYATMDGDTCGGLSPVAGIDKAFLRSYLRWLEERGPRGWHNIPALSAVNVQAPTAELRPPDRHQTDEADLMPYDVLDAIEDAAIGNKQTPLEVFEILRVTFAEHEPEQLVRWIERFFRLWCRNQWKRERFAPALHVDDKNLDPRSWCRFPILSGGFERELAQLRAAILPTLRNGARD